MSETSVNELMERLATLEATVRVIEDEREVRTLLAAYGPLVDSGQADFTAALWDEDGVYDVDEIFMRGQSQIRAMVESDSHQRWIRAGCAHLVGPPHVTVLGDRADAVCYSLMIVHQDGFFTVRRATANHWRLRRSPDGWKVTTRTSRVLDGRQESPRLLAEGLAVRQEEEPS